MVLNAAVQMLREADELKQKILKFKSGTSMLQERSLWATQQQLQKVYQKLLLLDLDYALDKKVEQDLWNVGFKQQIEALQAISKDRKNALRSEGQAMLSWVLQAAAGFYLCLLHQICTAFKLDLPFRRRASLLGWVSGWGTGPAGSPAPPAHARYICQHCLVHLGDLARYRQQPRLAHTFYRHALVVSVHCGQPYNQLALVWWRRGRRLCALYWHVRSLLVRAPFPPAPANLARTLQHAACAAGRPRDLPVLPGVAGGAAGGAVSGAGGGAGGGAACGEVGGAGGSSLPRRLDAHAYVNEFIRALHLIHTLEELDTAATIVDTLNSSLGPLIATESFESMTLIKMAVLVIWLVHSSCEEWQASGAQTPREQAAAALSLQLAAGAVLATALPAACAEPPRAALKVWLQWVLQHPQVAASAAWRARPQLWAALAHALNGMAPADGAHAAMATVPLLEDEELHGFLPLEASLRALRFPNHACWDSYGDRVPVADDKDFDRALGPGALAASPELQAKLRATRLRELGVQLADLHAPHLSYTEENGVIVFSSPCLGADDLTAALAELCAAGGDGEDPAARGEAGGEQEDSADGEGGEEVRVGPPPPVIISEAHFREKVREKRVGILKPQGSLERAREERAMANTQPDEPEVIDEESKTEDKKENRKPRVNIAMAAIMRKQEEVNKQVKFVSPPPSTPDSAVDNGDSKDDKPKVVQPKPVKSLANLPVGRKTGGILSLKDKSAGYPHLQKTDPEPKKDKEEKKEMKSSQCSQNSQQNYQPKRLDAPNTNWTTNYGDPRGGFSKAYGIQNQVGYSPGGLRLPVVNPKEIDVRSAALQKQSSRADLFPDGHRFAAGHPLSGDKKSFLSDLPPRFANQYRHWQGAQENQYSDNKFRDDAAPSAPHPAPRPAWPQQETYQQPMSWWKPDSAPPPNYNPNFSTQMNPNFYSSVPTYQTAFNPPTQPPQQKPDLMPGYLSQPPMHTLQNLVTSPSFSSSMSGFSSFGPSVSYDSSMYPQFNKPYPMKMDPKPSFQGNKEMLDMGLGFGANLDLQRNMNFNERADNGAMKSLDPAGSMDMAATGLSVVAEPGNTYSLFSGADPHTWASPQVHNPQGQQSLWSGPGPSPLERLLEQQRQRAPQ